MSQGAYQQMRLYFPSQAAAFSYLLFLLLYIPCVSTAAVITRELNKAWSWFSILWSLCLAYGVAVLFYQCATFNAHRAYSMIWIGSIICVYGLVVLGLAYIGKRGKRYDFIPVKTVFSSR